MTGKGLIGEYNDFWIVYYFGSELHWLETLAIDNDFKTYGQLSLGILGRFLSYCGLINIDGYDSYRQLALEFGSPTASFVIAPYLDFGLAGCLIVAIYGFFIGAIYRNNLFRHKMWTVFYATCAYQCIIAFYAFQFGLSSQIYVMLLLLFCCNNKIRVRL